MWALLEDIQTGLQSLTFTAQGTDTVRDIKSAAIVIRKLPERLTWWERNFQTETMPGILISPVSVTRPATAGTNVRDDALYKIVIQVLDKDTGKNKVRNLRTYLKWQEQIARYLQSQTRENVQTYSQGQVCIGWAVETDHLDESMWAKHEKMVASVAYSVKIRETRGT